MLHENNAFCWKELVKLANCFVVTAILHCVSLARDQQSNNNTVTVFYFVSSYYIVRTRHYITPEKNCTFINLSSPFSKLNSKVRRYLWENDTSVSTRCSKGGCTLLDRLFDNKYLTQRRRWVYYLFFFFQFGISFVRKKKKRIRLFKLNWNRIGIVFLF